MEFRVDLFKPKLEAMVLHSGETLGFNASVFHKKSFSREYDVFSEVNAYIKELPRSSQDKLFEIYSRAYKGFDYMLDPAELHEFITVCIRDLVGMIKLDNLELWLSLRPEIMIPESVKLLPPDPMDNVKSVGKTYTVADYYPLLALSMFLRFLIPIWGEYVASIRKNTDVDKKEFIALQLLNGTGVLESKAIERLRIYIREVTASSDNQDWEKVISGFSTEDIGFQLLAVVCFRRLCTADLRGSDPSTQVVAQIWKFSVQKSYGSPVSGIEIKEVREGEDSAADRSGLEGYRRRTDISLGNIAEFEYYFSFPHAIARHIDPTVPLELVDQALATAKQIEVTEIGDVQLAIAGELIKDQITPYSLYHTVDLLPNVLAACEAVLWHRGFKYLSAVVTSYAISGVEEMHVGSISSREQLTLENTEEIKRWFPYTWEMGKRTPSTVQHGILETVDMLVDSLIFHSWRMTISEEKSEEIFGERRRRLIIPSDIKNQIVSFLIDNERRIYNKTHQNPK